jgi:hypothetical protein
LDIAYGLTRQGGARWEKMARFDWRFHLSGFATEFEAANREMIEA